MTAEIGAAGQAPPAASESSASAEQINRLVRQLGDNDYFVREHAQDELAKLGVDAFDALVRRPKTKTRRLPPAPRTCCRCPSSGRSRATRRS